MIEEAPIPADAAIVTQIEAGRSGLLVNDPRDLKECGAALTGLLLDRRRAVAMGKRAHQRVGREYLAQVYLGRYLNLFTDLMSALLGSATGGPEARRWSTAG
ncbi:MAG TPA: hypothetical protein VMV09_04900 [Candidatus Saccharimonadales bacterium]|nr:hypothetical protein [Candidatus Saccharimonadales bacterium]